MNNLDLFRHELANAGYYCSQYSDSDDRFSSLIPQTTRFLCCLARSTKDGVPVPSGLSIIAYPGKWYSIIYTLGGRSYLCPSEASLANLVADALSRSDEGPTATISQSVLDAYGVQEIDVFSVLSASRLSNLDAALCDNQPFIPRIWLDEILRKTPVTCTVETSSGMVDFRYGKAKAIAHIQDQQSAVKRIQLAVMGIIQASKDSLEMMSYLLASAQPQWSIFHDVWGGMLDLQDPHYHFSSSGFVVEAPSYCL